MANSCCIFGCFSSVKKRKKLLNEEHADKSLEECILVYGFPEVRENMNKQYQEILQRAT